MKKFLMMACMMLFSTAMFAQQGAMYLGGNLNYGLHSDYKNFGFGVKAQYEFIQNFRAEASANYFLEKDNLKMWDINANLHYIFRITDNFEKIKIASTFIFILHIVFIGLDALFPVVEMVVGTVFPTQTKKVVALQTYP